MDDLTARQREIIQLVPEGFSAKEIAGHVGISSRIVEFHKAKVMEMLDLRTTAGPVTYAVAHGFVTSS